MKLIQFYISCRTKLVSLFNSLYEYAVFGVNPFFHHLFYYIFTSLLGYISLKLSEQSISSSVSRQNDDLDLFFTSVSASTISSMSTINMEDFSNTQLVILLFLMFFGGEIFISLIGLHLRKLKYRRMEKQRNLDSVNGGSKYRSIRALEHLVYGYLLISHIIGYSLISLYISIVPSAGGVLERKGIEMHLFSIFVAVSTFSNCGFIPTNENMMVFKPNSGLLLILIPQVLLGNKFYPCCLRLLIWAVHRLSKRDEFSHILEHNQELGYGLLVSKFHALLLAGTAVGLIMVQFVIFCLLEWNSEVLMGMNVYQKLVASLFQIVNTRHSGESIADLSLLSSATMLLFVLMMYLPSSIVFIPIEYHNKENNNSIKRKSSSNMIHNLRFSQLTYLAIFLILICFTERINLKEDPLNFNVFNICVEVVSAYGNVGFSMGYSCRRRLAKVESCKDAWYGFAGRWSKSGKFLLILVMLFGRLKRFNFDGGNAWKLI